jgi:hypothetical protein
MASATTANGAQLDTVISATASCPAGTVLLGGGANVTNSDSDHPARVQLVQSQPVGGNSWQATGAVDVGLGMSNSMTVTAFAVCTA